jgi:chemotaxis protein histidine kinase CheA
MVGLNKTLTDAETKLKDAQKELADAQAKADALRKAKDAEITAATEAMKAEFKLIEAGLLAAEAAAIKFKDQLILAQGAAKELARLYADAIKKQTDLDAAKLAAEKKELEDRKTAEKTAANSQAAADAKAATDADIKAKAAEKELDLVNELYGDEVVITKQAAEAIKRAMTIAKELREEANRLAKIAAASKDAALALNPIVPPPPPVVPPTPADPARIAKWRANNSWAIGILDSQVPSMPGYSSGGMVLPKYFASGGFSKGTDTIPAMLTPGEFVIKKSAVDSYGVKNISKINNGMSPDSSVYNYSLSVNVSGNNLNADDIASTVMQKIKYIDGQRIRGQR